MRRRAVDAGLRMQFSNARLNRAMDDYRHACVEQHVRDVLGSSSPARWRSNFLIRKRIAPSRIVHVRPTTRSRPSDARSTASVFRIS